MQICQFYFFDTQEMSSANCGVIAKLTGYIFQIKINSLLGILNNQAMDKENALKIVVGIAIRMDRFDPQG